MPNTLLSDDNEIKLRLMSEILAGKGMDEEASARAALPEIPTPEPLKAPTTLSTPPETPIDTHTPGIAERIGKMSPVIASVGAGLAKGAGSPFAEGAQRWADYLQNQQFTEAMKQATSEYLGGAPPVEAQYPQGMLGKTPARPTTIAAPVSRVDTTGLNPQQTETVMNTATGARAKSRMEPTDISLKVAQMKSLIDTGNYHSAHIPLLQAQAQKTLAEIQQMPITNMASLAEKNALLAMHMASIQKIQAEIPNIQANTQKTQEEVKTVPVERERRAAETVKTKKETAAIDWEKNPIYAQMRAAEKRAGMALQWHNTGADWKGTDESGKVISILPISESPNTGNKSVPGPTINSAKEAAAAKMLDTAKANLMAKYPKETQRAMVEFERLRATLKPGLTGDVDTTQLLAALTPPQRLEFYETMDTYSRATHPTGSKFGEATRAVQGKDASTQPTPTQPAKKTKIDEIVEKLQPVITAGTHDRNALIKSVMKSEAVSEGAAAFIVDKAIKGKAIQPSPTTPPKRGEAGAIEPPPQAPISGGTTSPDELSSHERYKRPWKVPGFRVR